jgi:hypothetical protein
LKLYAVFLFIQLYNNAKPRYKLGREAIVDVEDSAWRKLLESRNENSFLKMTGFTYAAFDELVRLVRAHRGEAEEEVGVKRGRRKLFTTEDEVGLYLFFICSTLDFNHLSMLFGTSPTLTNDTVNRYIVLMPQVLRDHPAARILFPSQAELANYAAMVTMRNNRRNTMDIITTLWSITCSCLRLMGKLDMLV